MHIVIDMIHPTWMATQLRNQGHTVDIVPTTHITTAHVYISAPPGIQLDCMSPFRSWHTELSTACIQAGVSLETTAGDDSRALDTIDEDSMTDNDITIAPFKIRTDPIPPSVGIITATVGTAALTRAIKSVSAQTYPYIIHYIVIDGPAYYLDVIRQIRALGVAGGLIRIISLPENTGANGFNGHRIYGAIPYLCNTDYIGFLDEDNWYEDNHVEALVNAITDGGEPAVGAYSYRNIVDPSGMFICRDQCESIGNTFHTVINKDDYLMDTSSFIMKRTTLVDYAPNWHVAARTTAMDSDRRMTQAVLVSGDMMMSSKLFTLNYTVESSPMSVRREFFIQGNETFQFELDRPHLYVFHFFPEATAQLFEWIRLPTDVKQVHIKNITYRDWQITQCDELANKFCLFNGYECQDNIPYGSIVLFHLCAPEGLPMEWLKTRPDIYSIIYTVESPNVRHAAQWDLEWLRQFDCVLTYWTPILRELGNYAVYMPQNTHVFNMDMPLIWSSNTSSRFDSGRPSVCMVLENRQAIGTYTINGEPLTCLDGLREQYARAVEIEVYGDGWTDMKDRPDMVRVRRSGPRNLDNTLTVDIYNKYQFAIIIENTNAEGYVSEKLYDALAAGTIPIYFGGTTPHMSDGLFIDLHELTATQLAAWLDVVSDEYIKRFRLAIEQQRVDLFKTVSAQAYADVISNIII